jgi:tRNA-dihydrouridine synthase
MFKQIVLKDKTVSPALFLAPMSGVTHSAFRRLLSDFGSYGALYTEMLSGSALLHENLEESPFTKRRACEGKVIYQLQLNERDNIKAVVEKISTIAPFGLDLNLGCPAPNIRKQRSGVELFCNGPAVDRILGNIRKYWHGILTVKCRLGNNQNTWKKTFLKNLNIFEEHQVEAVTVHPRFSKDKLKRRARWELFSWIAEQTGIPVIGNGDIMTAKQFNENKPLFSQLGGYMIGRAAIVKPWIFQEITESNFLFPITTSGFTVSYSDVWEKFYRYTTEDFPSEKAIGRIKEFSAYYARNFFFGHEFYRAVQGSKTLDEAYDSAMAFLTKNPRISQNLSVAGV